MRNFFGKIFNGIFNRFTITALFILLQLFYLCTMIFELVNYADWVGFIFKGVTVISAIYIVWRDYNPAYKIGWIILIAVFPILGGALYIMFGNKRPGKGIKKKIDPIENSHRFYLRQKDDIEKICKDVRRAATIDYISKEGIYPAWSETSSKYFELGEKFFNSMIDDMKKAQHFIFLEYFIIKKGRLWNEIYEILKSKAKEGVEIRIIYDDIGSINHLPMNFVKKLKKDGIEVVVFNPMKPFLSLVYNNRDHRKICIIDGYIGYNGGANIGDEYVNLTSKLGHWKDSGIRLEGNAVWNLTVMFLNMWNSFRKTEDNYEPYGVHVHHKEPFQSDGVVQPFSDTPLDEENLSENVYLEILNSAKNYVYIYTPYLIIDNEMETALKLAAKRGVDVRIVTPGIPDKKVVSFLSRSYYGNLIHAGVKIYEYAPGFIHAKSFVSDDKVAVVGTINIDYRSLYLHFECGTFLAESSTIKDIREDYEKTFKISREITESVLEGKWFDTAIAAILRVFSPIV